MRMDIGAKTNPTLLQLQQETKIFGFKIHIAALVQFSSVMT